MFLFYFMLYMKYPIIKIFSEVLCKAVLLCKKKLRLFPFVLVGVWQIKHHFCTTNSISFLWLAAKDLSYFYSLLPGMAMQCTWHKVFHSQEIPTSAKCCTIVSTWLLWATANLFSTVATIVAFCRTSDPFQSVFPPCSWPMTKSC